MDGVATSSSWLRVVLERREALRIERGYRQLRVRSGQAWVTFGGRDVTMPDGGSVELDAAAGPAVVTPLGSQPVLVELRRQDPQPQAADEAWPLAG
jgi:hypothetical protein